MPIAAIIRLLMRLMIPAFDGRRVAAAAARAAAAAVFLLLACLALLAAVGLAGAALWTYFATFLSSSGASLALAGVFVVLALLLLLGAWLTMNRRPKANPRPLAGVNPGGGEPIAALLAGASTLFNQHKSALLLAALVAGLVAERMQKRD